MGATIVSYQSAGIISLAAGVFRPGGRSLSLVVNCSDANFSVGIVYAARLAYRGGQVPEVGRAATFDTDESLLIATNCASVTAQITPTRNVS